jgi:SAM-dependent methyltransferase
MGGGVVKSLYVDPLMVSQISECIFYHSMDLPEYGKQEGQWDLIGRFDDYINRVDLRGKRVLDVGTASGFLTFEAEKRGASVVSFDLDSAVRLQKLPFKDSHHMIDRDAWLMSANDFISAMKKSYWLSHRLFKSQARVHYGDVYNISEELGIFDVVIVGQILVHLSDVISALVSVASRCKDTLIIVEGMIDDEWPIAAFVGRVNNPQVDYSFWQYSIGFYKEMLGILGFRFASSNRGAFKCNVDGTQCELTTLVFQRV